MTTLLPSHKISPPDWMLDPDLITVLDTLNDDGINARMVGGCIRNYYMNKKIHDIDIACKLTPEKSKEKLKKHNIKIIPTGLQHGTITAHINNKNFEITTLRTDKQTDGRHANVDFTADWTEDAKRRDFTINALYADRDGSIYDPLGTGIDDLQNKIVRFIGDAEHRIKEDHLRILRFFRFFAEYSETAHHQQSFNACKKLKNNIYKLSDERIADELYKILSKNSSPHAIQLMSECNLFGLTTGTPERLKEIITLQNQLGKTDLNTRYFSTDISKKYIKNKKIKLFFNKIDSLRSDWKNNTSYCLYKYGRDICIQGLITMKAENKDVTDKNISDAMNLPVPIFPLCAQDIMQNLHIPEGPEIGQKLRDAENIWIESNFTLKHNEIINLL